jgi:dolichyl-phosphate-mannose--protein O-mannosyl transferase
VTADSRSRYFFAVSLAAILFLGLILRAWGLSGASLTGDEISSAISAKNYLHGGSVGPTMWNHPNLRNLLLGMTLSSGVGAFWAIKGASLVLGLLTLFFLVLLTREISGSAVAGLIAGLLLAMDPLHIDFSRQAIHEIYMACFSLAGVWLCLLSLRHQRLLPLFAAGVCFGLGISSKWEPVFPLTVMFCYLLQRTLFSAELDLRAKAARSLLIGGALGALPLTIYLLTYLPWFLHGKDLADWLLLQQEMFRETVRHAGYNAYNYTISYSAADWFVKPVEFVDVIFGSDGVKILIGITNPLVWCLVLPAAAWFLFSGVRERQQQMLLVVALFTASYLPYLTTSRPIWAHSAFSVFCFGLVMLASVLTKLAERSGEWRRAVVGYLLLVTCVAAPLYLLAIGKGEEYQALRPVFESYRPAHER